MLLTVVMTVGVAPLGNFIGLEFSEWLGDHPLTASAAYENTYTNTGNQRDDIIGVAKTQIGYREGNNNDTKYGDWYGLPNQPWCAMFIS